jgi:hypothetical protein
MNLFLSTRLLTQQREDHLTEFLAATLDLYPRFAQNYIDFVLGDYARKKKWSKPRLAKVETQVQYPGCVPDMRLTLKDGHVIVCEHKLEAIETISSADEEESIQTKQLERYLNLNIDGLVFVRASWKSPSKWVLHHPIYVKPSNREHFLWRDFYPILQRRKGKFIRWMRDGFRQLGFTPPHPQIGDLLDPDLEKRKANQRNFAKLWSGVRRSARSLGWKIERGSIVQLYLKNNPKSRAEMVFISPSKAERFLISITPRKSPKKILENVESITQKLHPELEVKHTKTRRKEGSVEVIHVISTLQSVLGNAKTTEQMENALFDFVVPILEIVQ